MFAFKEEPKMGECDLNDAWVKMYFEFRDHPFYETTDIVMAGWFAREAAKVFLRGDDGPHVY